MSTISRMGEPGHEFLASAYRTLGYEDGKLIDAANGPDGAPEAGANWVEIGDWLTLAHRMGADKVFFAGTEPVLVFREVSGPVDEAAVRTAYRQAWCMSGPQCLFLALPGELRVYALTEPPVRWPVETRVIEPLQVVRRITDVAEALREFAREEVESGRLFGDSRFGDSVTRADRRLVQDLRIVRGSLIAEGARPEYAHALIGRSIFIRYLEDRGVLTPAYFEQVARKQPAWAELLSHAPERPDLRPLSKPRLYDRVLLDREFTYALFDQLAHDFNGDMFPRDEGERENITIDHLKLLRNFLLGDADHGQPSLFFWAYDFEMIPISLISSIYEEFYRSTDDADDNTHYTPSTLVGHVLSRVLTPERLAARPRVLDPACGSGIFLVEAFRRIVRFEAGRRGPLSPDDLRSILRDQIAGIELNAEAARVAAFSLYLSLLNYQEPPEILQSAPLPHLIYDGSRDEEHYGILFATNAFALTTTERETLQARVNARKRFSGRAAIERLLDSSDSLSMERAEFDVVVGNPPWLEAKRATGAGDTANAIAAEQAVGWAEAFGCPVGDRSYSQLFIHRALTFLKPDGAAGMLVSAKVIWNQRRTSRAFRQYWLAHAHVREVVNFTHARRVFFDHAVAPFLFVRFDPREEGTPLGHVVYWSARLTRAARQLRSVVFTRIDRRIIPQGDLRKDDTLWKTYWWGSHRDAALVARLGMEMPLRAVLRAGDPEPAYGFQPSGQPPRQDGKNVPSGALKYLPELVSGRITWYGPLRESWFEGAPTAVKRQPDTRLYEGQRLLSTTGIKASFGPCVRLETAPFSFRHTMYCVPLPSLSERQAKLVLGIFWSSLGRYRLFMISGSWGGWYDKVTAEDILGMPVRLSEPQVGGRGTANDVIQRVVDAVDAIRAWIPPAHPSILDPEDGWGRNQTPPEAAQAQLDQAIFDLLELSEPEQDLVRDFFEHAFDLLNNGPESAALARVSGLPAFAQGTFAHLDGMAERAPAMARYLRVFLDAWNRELVPEGEFRWQLISPHGQSLVAVVFETQTEGEALPANVPEEDIASEWAAVLRRCEEALRQPLSEHMYMDRIVRAVTPTSITVIKPNERRLWSASAAREDAEATLVQAMQLPQVSEPR